MNKHSFDIEDLEPFFEDKFRIKIPSNLKPAILSMSDSNLSEKELTEYNHYGKYFFQKNAPPKLPLGMVWLPRNWNSEKITEEEQLKVDVYEQKFIELNERNNIANELFLKKGEVEKHRIKKIKLQNKISARPIIYWLANKVGQVNQNRGLTIEGLKNLPEGVFQLGQEDSNTKGYFVYTSTSIKRRVRIRFVQWNQYDSELARSSERLDCVQKFFQNFERFEDEVKERIDSLFLFFDEYVGTEIDIKLKNGQRIIRDKGFGGRDHINYDFFTELLDEIEIKTTTDTA